MLLGFGGVLLLLLVPPLALVATLVAVALVVAQRCSSRSARSSPRRSCSSTASAHTGRPLLVAVPRCSEGAPCLITSRASPRRRRAFEAVRPRLFGIAYRILGGVG